MTKQFCRKDFISLEKRRYRGIILLKKGISQAEVAGRLGVSRQAVHTWWKIYQQGGWKVLKHRTSTGRPKKFLPRMKTKLFLLLSRGAQRFGFATDLWTINRIVQLIEDTFGITLHRSHVHRLLIAGGWTCQKPQRRAIERDDKAIQWWVKVKWPAIKKKPSN